MIYTVTFNPSLDYIIQVKEFQLGSVNRASYEQILEGGKGINVSIVLKNLGIDSVALGFTAGFTGDQIDKRVSSRGIETNFIELNQGISRINVKLKSNEESEINGQGPAISEEAIKVLFGKLSALGEEDILVLAGSIPNTLPEDIYQQILHEYKIKNKQVKVVVDATKDLLKNVLEYKPFLIKPNNHELGELFGVELKNQEDIVFYAKKLQDEGARNVLISMAGEGAILITEHHKVLHCKAPMGKVVNSVGAGDSMVAGFIAGYLTTGDYEHAFKMGVATGSASAFSKELAKKEEVEALFYKI